MRLPFIKRNMKYIVFIALLLVFFLFGRHYDRFDDGFDQTLKQKQREIMNIQKGIFEIKAAQQSSIIKLSDKYQLGDSIRLFYDIETEDDITSKPHEKRPIDFSIYLASDYGEEQLIDSGTLSVPTKIMLREIRFTSMFDSSKLVVKRYDTRTTGSLVVNNIRSFRIEVGARGFDGFLPTIHGRTDLSKIIFQTHDSFEGAFPLVFTRKQQLFGQAFTANSERIFSVDLALSWRGAGGAGDYLLELREASDSGDYSHVISYYYFNQGTIRDNLIEDNVYRLPLSANLEKGKNYLISVNNYNIHFNLLNTLEIGSTDVRNDGADSATMTIADGKKKSVPNLFLRVNGADCLRFNGSCVLNGAIIQDLGGGIGLYSYESTGQPIDFLDLFQYDPGTFFDNSKGGIIAPTNAETSFYYKFDTIYPYKKIKVTVNQSISGSCKNRLFYSFDNTNWIPIDQNANGNLIVEKTIEAQPNNRRELFIKVTYDKDDAKYTGSSYFGMTGIKVQATLNLTN